MKARKNLFDLYPQLKEEWSGKNTLDFPHNSGRYWWKCSLGHEWEAYLSNRVKGRGCPFCSGRRPVRGVNDLATVNPVLALQWSDQNEKSPSEFLPQSGAKVLWKCTYEHEWSATISNRTKGKGCPYCTNKKVLVGFNDLDTTYPKVALEWHPDNALPSTAYTGGSNQKVLWRCVRMHEWSARIAERSKGDTGCPYCVGKMVIPGENDLATMNPGVALQWHPDNVISAGEVLPFSNRKFLWLCSNGHEWVATVYSRAEGRGCPYCTNQRVLPGYNDLMSSDPELASQWHPDNGLTPEEVTCGSNRKVMWRCEREHEWASSVADRRRGRGCPYCAGQEVFPGFNDLGTNYPELVSEWHSDNPPIESVGRGSSFKAKWICNEGHEWYAVVFSRSRNGSGCPKCIMHGTSKQEQDVADFVAAVYNGQIVRNSRLIIAPKELDIYMPEIKKAIEFNGAYWHNRLPEDYHDNKTIACQEQGVQLMHVWDTSWIKDQEKEKARIRRFIDENS